MVTKDAIKNVMQEKLQHLSKEELIDVISDLSSVYIMTRIFGVSVSVMSPSNSSVVRTDLSDIINKTASSLANRELAKMQAFEDDRWLFKKNIREC